MTIIECPMCLWRAGVVGGQVAEHYVREMHIDAHVEAFRYEMGSML